MIAAGIPARSRAVQEFLAAPHDLLIDGVWVPALSGKRFETHDPATGQKLAMVAEAEAPDLDLAVAAARRAFEGPWSRLTARARGNLLDRLAGLIEDHIDLLTEIEVLDSGMLRSIARHTVASRPDLFRYYAGWPQRIEGATIPNSNARPEGTDLFTYTLREPVGVAGLIVPWNVPLALACLKLAPALAAGCTVVLKPAELTPLSALLLGRLILDAGFPPGVVNILNGFGPTLGAAMASHEGIDKISFTGSTATGKHIARAAIGNLKRISLELGGKAPAVVFADADLDLTIPALAQAIFAFQGQNCMAATRIIVEAGVFDRVVAGVAGIAARLRLGHGMDSASEIGPMISAGQRDRVLKLIESGKQAAAELVVGGQAGAGPGYFLHPAVFANTTRDMRIMREEIFGPVGCFQPFANGDFDAALTMANDTEYGLAASVWTTHLATAHKMAARIRAGQVAINAHGATGVNIPFGGFKQSGWGREFAKDGLDLFLETKSVTAWLNTQAGPYISDGDH
jgi:phenylacetaldehyde dehydrogenase